MSHRMYAELADWWTLLSPVDEYGEEAALFRDAIVKHAHERPRTLLELGAGGGNNAFHLKADFEMTLADLSEDMVRQSRKINPELEHHTGDMRTLRLDRLFDAVFIHDAISYMTTREDLRRALETAAVHCRAGGIALFAPDETKERFVPSTDCGGVDDGARGFRYLEWVWDPDPDDDLILSDYGFFIRNERGEVRVEHERHVQGVFPRQLWIDTMRDVGFEPTSVVVEHSDLENGYELFVGIKR